MPGGRYVRTDMVIEEPGVLCVGGDEEFANILEILKGQVTVDIPECAAGGIVSASAAVGISTAKPGTWRAWVYPAAWGSAAMHIPAAAPSNGAITVTASNPSASAFATFTANLNYLAIRTVS